MGQKTLQCFRLSNAYSMEIIEKVKPLLILGCQRSGTTLLASMLGRHSEINMLFESTTNDVFRLIGKKYQGNKLLVWRQIRMSQRSSYMGHIINRIVNFHFFGKKHHKHRPYPISELCIEDYLDRGAKVIYIRRPEKEVVSSITKRTPMTEKQATQEYFKCTKILDAVSNKALEITFHDLVNNPQSTMKIACEYLDLQYEEGMMDGAEFNIVYPHKKIMSEKSKL